MSYSCYDMWFDFTINVKHDMVYSNLDIDTKHIYDYKYHLFIFCYLCMLSEFPQTNLLNFETRILLNCIIHQYYMVNMVFI